MSTKKTPPTPKKRAPRKKTVAEVRSSEAQLSERVDDLESRAVQQDAPLISIESRTTIYGIAKYVVTAATVVLAAASVRVDPVTGLVELPPDGVPWYIYALVGLRLIAGVAQSIEMHDRPEDMQQ